MKFINRLKNFFIDDRHIESKKQKITIVQAYKRLLKAHEEDLKKVIDVEGEDAYLISEHIREGCTSCPFCFDRDLNFSVVDETHTGVLLQSITCLDCGESWTVEYEASRVKYKNKWYNRYEHWPTFLQANSPDYKKMQKVKYGLK
jgi:transposase-like protein